jgi:hypothetical protein
MALLGAPYIYTTLVGYGLNSYQLLINESSKIDRKYIFLEINIFHVKLMKLFFK